MWTIPTDGTNNGYPYNTEFSGIISNIWNGKHNDSLWRIDSAGVINDGYPYNYYMNNWVGADEEDDDTEKEHNLNTQINRLYNSRDFFYLQTAASENFYTADMWDYDYPQVNYFTIFNYRELFNLSSTKEFNPETSSNYGCLSDEPNIMIPADNRYIETENALIKNYQKEQFLQPIEISIRCHFFGDDYQIPAFCKWVRSGDCLGVSSSLEYYYRIQKVEFSSPNRAHDHHYTLEVKFTCMPYKFLYEDLKIKAYVKQGIFMSAEVNESNMATTQIVNTSSVSALLITPTEDRMNIYTYLHDRCFPNILLNLSRIVPAVNQDGLYKESYLDIITPGLIQENAFGLRASVVAPTPANTKAMVDCLSTEIVSYSDNPSVQDGVVLYPYLCSFSTGGSASGLSNTDIIGVPTEDALMCRISGDTNEPEKWTGTITMKFNFCTI